MARSQQRERTRKEAFNAARASAAGESREAIRALYESELRARGLEVPPDEILEAEVDAITGDYRSIARLVGRALGDLPRMVRDIFRPPF